MSIYRELEIYQVAFVLAKKVHFASLKLPSFELYEQGSQISRSSKSIKDQIAEGYGRRRYKMDFIKFLTYSHASCDETISQLEMIKALYPEINDFLFFFQNMRTLVERFFALFNMLRLVGSLSMFYYATYNL
jgi:four helix bundle protein